MFRTYFALILVMISISACGDRPVNLNQGGSGRPGVALTAAVGWEALSITSGYTVTKLDVFAHFEIDRNGCYQGGSGAIPLEHWNELAAAMNVAATEAPRSEEACTLVAGSTRWALDGAVELTRTAAAGGGKREVLRARGREVCTTLKDLALAERALRAIDQALYAAFTEDCASAQ